MRNEEQLIESFIKEAQPTLTINIEPRFYHKKDKSFIFEMSDVDLNYLPGGVVYLRNPKTNNKMRFLRTKIDKDATGEDTYGWHYRSDNGKYTLLIIND